MRKPMGSILAVAALIAPVTALPAEPKSPKLAKCDGKQRRPANPYGSILPTVDPQAATATPPGPAPGRNGVDVFDPVPEATPPAKPSGKPAAKPEQVPPISGAVPLSSYRSC